VVLRKLYITNEQHDSIGGVMINVLASSVVNRGFEPWWIGSNQRLCNWYAVSPL